jgi:hypothetical protein
MIMEHKTYPTIFRNFSIAVLLLFSSNIFSCGWSESYETSRLALFRASRPSFIKLGDYSYSLDLYSESPQVSDRDQKQNCREWIAKLGGGIKVDDVYAILYQTSAEEFENAIQSKDLATVFKENTFVKSLSLPKNKPFLDYISVAKQMEYSHQNDGKWESWEESDNQYEGVNDTPNRIIEFDKLIKNSKDKFLKQRYAFLQLRSIFYGGMTAYKLDENETPNTIQSLYDTYFKDNTKTILAPWAMYYMALKLENKALSNYYLSKVLVNCDDKGNAVIRHFDEKLTNETLAFAKNDFERGIIKSIKLLYNPSPALEDLKEIALLMPESEYFSFLVEREVNKIEDWIFTPKYSNSTRSDYIDYDENKTEADYVKARLENEQKDLKYLQDLKTLLIEIQEKSSGEQKDFLSAAIAQLCFINDEIDAGNTFTQQISEKANPSIQLQKSVQLALVALKQNDIKTPETQEKLYNCFNDIENAVENDNTLFKSMYSLYRIASSDFYNKKDVVTAGLLFMKSGTKQGSYYYSQKYFYNYIGYFDRMATPKDMDVLMALAEKSNKTNFEKYICSGNIAQDLNVYCDLKGTLAFRNNDLELAGKTFSEMPKKFWEKTYEFKNYLNENPFFPKALQTDPKSRNFKYKFNKLDFVNEMIRLQKSKSASDYLKLANAYFNVSAYGNAWMMTSYEQSGGSYNDYIYGDSLENQKKYGIGNYLNLNLAKEYYQKALLASTNKEQKAVCSLMLFECDYYNNSAFTYDKEGKFTVLYKGNAIKDFYSIYEDTKVFKKYNCLLLENFIN